MLLRVCLWFYLLLFWVSAGGYSAVYAQIASPSITVNLPSRTIEVFSGDRLVKEFPIAIGKPSTPTPIGTYSIVVKEVNPAWYPPDQPGRMVPSGPGNPLGYRWLGIWNNYGIHGTNAPGSIGSAVSNGCIRMHEAHVEELFDLVDYGTPVRIIYDRVKVRTNAKGQVLLSVYPDVYGYGSITLQDIRNKLNPYRLNQLVADEVLRKMLNDPSDQQVPIASQFKIRVNGKELNARGLVVQDVQYVPVYAAAEALKQQVTWNAKDMLVQCGAVTVPGIVSGDIVYVSTDNLSTLFSCEQSWKPDENTLNFDKLVVLLNDKPVSLEVNKLQGILAVPALPLAETMGRKVKWTEDNKTLTMNDKGKNVAVPVDMVGTVPYIKITNINQYFDAYVYWNEGAKTIELTYP